MEKGLAEIAGGVSKHTDGPWVHCDSIPGYHGPQNSVVDLNGKFIAEMWDDNKANAHLIAAAPEMYDKLNEVYGWLMQIATNSHDFTQEEIEDICMDTADEIAELGNKSRGMNHE